MAIEIHRSGALEEALKEAVARIEFDLSPGDRLQVNGTIKVGNVSSDPDGSTLVQGEFEQARSEGHAPGAGEVTPTPDIDTAKSTTTREEVSK